jgi:hypothetical protein
MKNISSPFIEIGHWRRFLSSKKVGGESNSQVDLPQGWKKLFRFAVMFLEKAGISSDRWIMGGGTVLMFHYMHRLSKDIDIFFNDPQLLTFLTPRLNDLVATYVSDYDEQSNFLKLRFSDGEIDYIVAPNLTGLEPFVMKVDDVSVRTDMPEEIVIKKIYYRTESLKIRDIIDIASVVKYREESLRHYMVICSGKLDILKRRIELIKPHFKEGLTYLYIIDKNLAESAIDIVEEFLHKLISNLKPPVAD